MATAGDGDEEDVARGGITASVGPGSDGCHTQVLGIARGVERDVLANPSGKLQRIGTPSLGLLVADVLGKEGLVGTESFVGNARIDDVLHLEVIHRIKFGSLESKEGIAQYVGRDIAEVLGRKRLEQRTT